MSFLTYECFKRMSTGELDQWMLTDWTRSSFEQAFVELAAGDLWNLPPVHRTYAVLIFAELEPPVLVRLILPLLRDKDRCVVLAAERMILSRIDPRLFDETARAMILDAMRHAGDDDLIPMLESRWARTEG